MTTTIPATALLACFALVLTASAPFEGSATSADPPATPIRVASYNAWLLPIGADDVDERLERMGPAIDALEPDVLCLQEVWTVQAFEPLAESLAGRLPEVATGGGGLAVLSRWPLRDAEFEAFPLHEDLSLVERFARKGWLTVVIETPAGPVRVVDTHLVFDRSEGRGAHSSELALLVDWLRDQTDLPTVLCGDLNMRGVEAGAASPGFASLLGIGFEDAAGAAGGGGLYARAGTRVGWPRAGRTGGWDPDYVLFRQGAVGRLSVSAFTQALDTEETALSDHNLQLVDFVLEP